MMRLAVLQLLNLRTQDPEENEFDFEVIEDHPSIAVSAVEPSYDFVKSASALDMSKEYELMRKYESEDK